MSSRPPVNVDMNQRTFYGVPFRTGLILVLTAIPVLAIVFAIGGLPVWLRGGLAILIAGLGLSLAFGQVDGQTPEAWLMKWFDFRRGNHVWVHRAQKQASEPSATLPTQQPKMEPKAATAGAAVHAKPVPLATQSTRAMPSFFFLTANTLGLALVTGLTLYLQQGGAERLIHLLHQF